MRELVIVASCPGMLRFAWENYIFLNNLRERGLSNKAEILVFIPHDKLETGPHPMWKQLEKDFPEVGIFYYKDRPEFNTSILRLQKLFDYDPICRVFCLASHFKAFPEIEKKAILYTDSDILITEHFDINPYLEDDVCYMSDAASYTNSDYFDSKSDVETNSSSPNFNQPKYVNPQKFEAFKRRDILQECARACGVTRAIVEANKNNSGGAQYLLKNIDYKYWNNVFDACIELRTHLKGINYEYMRGNSATEKENNGFQSFCADMWAVLWTLWKRGQATLTPKEWDFAWSTDDVSKLKEVAFYHNAGITSDCKLKRKVDKVEIEAPAFFKGGIYFNSENAITPFHEDFQPILEEIISNPVSQSFCNGFYAKEIKKVKTIYNL